MFLLIGNSGSNHNYIGLTLAGHSPQHKLTYHNFGTHGDINVVDISNMPFEKVETVIKKQNPLFMVCFASKWNDALCDLSKRLDVNVIQILIDQHRECMLINWQEKLRVNAMDEVDSLLSKDWEQQQKQIWSKYTTFPIERAVMEWTYKLYDNNFVDVKQSKLCDHYFSFGSMYQGGEETVNEFAKFGVGYDKQQYQQWKQSQKLVFDSWQKIKSKQNNPKELTHDYQRGVAIALRGIQESLTPAQCWQQYEQLLN